MRRQTQNWDMNTYNNAKMQAINSINNNTDIIILYGNGGNGKTQLTTDLFEELTRNTYLRYHPDVTYSWTKDDFEKEINNIPGKKLLHFLFNPFEKWNISCPAKPIDVINMNIMPQL